jgi:hypothetical protein
MDEKLLSILKKGPISTPNLTLETPNMFLLYENTKMGD